MNFYCDSCKKETDLYFQDNRCMICNSPMIYTILKVGDLVIYYHRDSKRDYLGIIINISSCTVHSLQNIYKVQCINRDSIQCGYREKFTKIKTEKPIMKKIRILRDMPYAKKGEIFNISSFSAYVLHGILSSSIFELNEREFLIQEGWIEYVKEEKTLEEKFNELEIRKFGLLPTADTGYKLSKLAKEHFLEVFDNVIIDRRLGFTPITREEVKQIRKALEDA